MKVLSDQVDVPFEKEQVKHVSQELSAVRAFLEHSWFARLRGLIPVRSADQGPHGRARSTVLEVHRKWTFSSDVEARLRLRVSGDDHHQRKPRTRRKVSRQMLQDASRAVMLIQIVAQSRYGEPLGSERSMHPRDIQQCQSRHLPLESLANG